MLCFLDFRNGRDIKFAFCTTRSPNRSVDLPDDAFARHPRRIELRWDRACDTPSWIWQFHRLRKLLFGRFFSRVGLSYFFFYNEKWENGKRHLRQQVNKKASQFRGNAADISCFFIFVIFRRNNKNKVIFKRSSERYQQSYIIVITQSLILYFIQYFNDTCYIYIYIWYFNINTLYKCKFFLIFCLILNFHLWVFILTKILISSAWVASKVSPHSRKRKVYSESIRKNKSAVKRKYVSRTLDSWQIKNHWTRLTCYLTYCKQHFST